MHNTLHCFEALTRLLVIAVSCCFVQALAQFTIAPGDINVTEGSPLIINCSFTNATRLFWRKDGSEISAREVNFSIETVDAGTSRLTLLPSADHTVHTGAYQCVAVSGSREDSVDFNITVQYLSDPILRLEPFECVEDDGDPYLGSTVIINCIAEGEPFPQVTWFYYSYELEVREGIFSNVGFQQNNRQLVVSQLHGNNAGDYHCRSENVIGQKSSTYTHLRYRTTGPETMIDVVNDVNGIIFAPLGGIGRINCQVIPPFPPVNLSVETVLFREGTTTIQTGNDYSILFQPACSVFSLVIRNISSIHTTYRCSFRQSTATTHLRIAMIIPIRVSISSPVVAVGGDVNMNCSFERRPNFQDVPQMLTWRFTADGSRYTSVIIPDGQRVIITTDAAGTSANLTIRGVTLDDHGTYVCRAFNPENLAIPVTRELNLVVGGTTTVNSDVSDGTTNSMDVTGGTTVSSDISGGTMVTSGVSDKSATRTISIIQTATLFLSGLVVH